MNRFGRKPNSVYHDSEDDFNSDEHFQKLQRDEDARERLVSYAYQRGWKLLFHWKGTIIRMVLLDSQIWISIMCYFLGRHLVENGTMENDSGPLLMVSVIGGMLSFLVVFYSTECYHRYAGQYQAQCTMRSDLYNVAMYACSCSLPELEARHLLRYLNASHIAGYTGVSSVYTSDNYGWPLIRKFNLLTESEIGELIELQMEEEEATGVSFRTLVLWCDRIMTDMVKQQTCTDKDKLMLTRYLNKYAEAMHVLFDFQELSIPFSYAHLISTLLVIYCPLFAFAVAFSATTFTQGYGWVLVILSNIYFNGLYMLSKIFQDPYGNDTEDLCVLKTVKKTIRSSMCLLQAMKAQRIHDDKVEEELDAFRCNSHSPATHHTVTSSFSHSLTPNCADVTADYAGEAIDAVASVDGIAEGAIAMQGEGRLFSPNK